MGGEGGERSWGGEERGSMMGKDGGVKSGICGEAGEEEMVYRWLATRELMNIAAFVRHNALGKKMGPQPDLEQNMFNESSMNILYMKDCGGKLA